MAGDLACGISDLGTLGGHDLGAPGSPVEVPRLLFDLFISGPVTSSQGFYCESWTTGCEQF